MGRPVGRLPEPQGGHDPGDLTGAFFVRMVLFPRPPATAPLGLPLPPIGRSTWVRRGIGCREILTDLARAGGPAPCT